MEEASQFLAEIASAAGTSSVEERSSRLCDLLSVSLFRNRYIKILNLLRQDLVISDLAIEKYSIFNNDWQACLDLIKAFLRLSNQLNAWLALESFDLYADYIGLLAIAFSNPSRGYLLAPLIRETVHIVLPMLVHIDKHAYFREAGTLPRLTHLAAVLLRIFNNVRSQAAGSSDMGANAKRGIILFVSNNLCLVYFRLGNPLLCRNIFSNMGNAQLKMLAYSVFEQAQYRFFLARFYLIKDQLIDCHDHLIWCLGRVPMTNLTKNAARILKYLLPVLLVLGKRINVEGFSQMLGPHGSAAAEPILKMYKSIGDAIAAGNMHRFYQTISENYDYLRDEGLLLLVSNKCKLLVLRNLMRRIYKMLGNPRVISYDQAKAGLVALIGTSVITRQSILVTPLVNGADQVDDIIIENVFVTLIDQSLLKAKILTSLRKVSLSKNDAFPNISNVYFQRFKPQSNDQWMSQ